MRIGALLSASYPWFEEAKKSGKHVRMDLVVTEEQNFKKLLTERIDLFSLDIHTGYAILQKHFTPEESALITYHQRPIEKWEHCTKNGIWKYN